MPHCLRAACVAWGVLHGTVLIVERAVVLKGLARIPVALQRL
jgi:hypothetical protein